MPTYMACCMLGSVIGVPAQALMGKHLGAFYLGMQGAEADLEMGGWQVGVAAVGLGSLLSCMKVLIPALIGKDDQDVKAAEAVRDAKDK